MSSSPPRTPSVESIEEKDQTLSHRRPVTEEKMTDDFDEKVAVDNEDDKKSLTLRQKRIRLIAHAVGWLCFTGTVVSSHRRLLGFAVGRWWCCCCCLWA